MFERQEGGIQESSMAFTSVEQARECSSMSPSLHSLRRAEGSVLTALCWRSSIIKGRPFVLPNGQHTSHIIQDKMSYSLVFPSQPEDFEALLDKVLAERYGAPSSSQGRKRHLSTSGTSPVSKVIRPKMDVVEKDDAFIISTELPGARKGLSLSSN